METLPSPPPAGVNGETPPAPAAPLLPAAVVVRHEVPVWTVVKVVLAAALTLAVVALLGKLVDVFLMLFVAFLLTAALDPVVGRLEHHGWPRPLSVALLVLALVAAVAGVLYLLIPPLVAEGTQLANHGPGYVERARRLLRDNQALVDRVRGAAGSGSATPTSVATGVLAVGSGAVQGVSDLLIVLVMTVYLLVDGERSYNWVVHYLPTDQRAKVRRALPEVSRVVSGYVVGQLVTSLLFGLFAFVVLTLVGVPQPLLLATAAALLDALPMVGILLATLPAVGLALTVSPLAALVVAACYVAYHQLESHLLVPRIYANRLRISAFAVLVAVLVGWTLLGLLGVLLALPIAAAVPAVEQIWRGEAVG